MLRHFILQSAHSITTYHLYLWPSDKILVTTLTHVTAFPRLPAFTFLCELKDLIRDFKLLKSGLKGAYPDPEAENKGVEITFMSQHNNPDSRTRKGADFAESLNVSLCRRLQCSTPICKPAQIQEEAYTKIHATLIHLPLLKGEIGHEEDHALADRMLPVHKPLSLKRQLECLHTALQSAMQSQPALL